MGASPDHGAGWEDRAAAADDPGCTSVLTDPSGLPGGVALLMVSLWHPASWSGIWR